MMDMGKTLLWLSRDAWNINETASILLGYQNQLEISADKRNDLITTFDLKDTITLLEQAIATETLTAVLVDSLGRELEFYLLKPNDVIQWVKTKRELFPNFPFYGENIEEESRNEQDQEMMVKQPQYEEKRSGSSWQQKAREIAVELNYSKEGKQMAVAEDIANQLEKEGIFGRGGRSISAETVRRQVLTPLGRGKMNQN